MQRAKKYIKQRTDLILYPSSRSKEANESSPSAGSDASNSSVKLCESKEFELVNGDEVDNSVLEESNNMAATGDDKQADSEGTGSDERGKVKKKKPLPPPKLMPGGTIEVDIPFDNDKLTIEFAPLVSVGSGVKDAASDAGCVVTPEQCMTPQQLQLEKFKRTLAIEMSMLRRENVADLWPHLNRRLGCSCKPLWSRMSKLTIKKMSRLLMRGDLVMSLKNSVRMTKADWELSDIILTHDKFDKVIPKEAYSHYDSLQSMTLLLQLVQVYGVECCQQSELKSSWSELTRDYNTDGRQCSVLLLQRRWCEMKLDTRDFFYTYLINFPKLNVDKPLVQNDVFEHPIQIFMAIAQKFPEVVTNEVVTWKTLIEQNRVFVPHLHEEPEQTLTSTVTPLDQGNAVNESEQDLLLVEPLVETIDLDEAGNHEVSLSKDADSTGKEVKREEERDMETSESSTTSDDKVNSVDGSADSCYRRTDDNNVSPTHNNLSLRVLNESSLDKEPIISDEVPSNVNIPASLDSNIVLDSGSQNTDDQNIKNRSPAASDKLGIEKPACEILEDGNNDKDDCLISNDSSVTKRNVDLSKSCDSSLNETDMNVPSEVNVKNKVNNEDRITRSPSGNSDKLNTESRVNIDNNDGSIAEDLNDKCVQDSMTRCNSISTIDLDNECDDMPFVEISSPVANIPITHDSMVDAGGGHDVSMYLGAVGDCFGMNDPEVMFDILSDGECELTVDSDFLKKLERQHCEIKRDFFSHVENVVPNSAEPKIDEKLLLVPKIYCVNLTTILGPYIVEPLIADKETCDYLVKTSKRRPKMIFERRAEIDKKFNPHKVIERIYKNASRIKRVYNPIALCKNPDFNTRLKRISFNFLASERNRGFLQMCKPITIDLFNCNKLRGSLQSPVRAASKIVPITLPAHSLFNYPKGNHTSTSLDLCDSICRINAGMKTDVQTAANPDVTTKNQRNGHEPSNGSSEDSIARTADTMNVGHEKDVAIKPTESVGVNLIESPVEIMETEKEQTITVLEDAITVPEMTIGNVRAGTSLLRPIISCDRGPSNIMSSNGVEEVTNPVDNTTVVEPAAGDESRTAGAEVVPRRDSTNQTQISYSDIFGRSTANASTLRQEKPKKKEKPKNSVPVPWYSRVIMQQPGLITKDTLARMIDRLNHVDRALNNIEFCCLAKRHRILNDNYYRSTKKKHPSLEFTELNIHNHKSECSCCCVELLAAELVQQRYTDILQRLEAEERSRQEMAVQADEVSKKRISRVRKAQSKHKKPLSAAAKATATPEKDVVDLTEDSEVADEPKMTSIINKAVEDAILNGPVCRTRVRPMPQPQPRSPAPAVPAQVPPIQVSPIQVSPIQVSPIQVSPIQVPPIQVPPIQVPYQPGVPQTGSLFFTEDNVLKIRISDSQVYDVSMDQIDPNILSSLNPFGNANEVQLFIMDPVNLINLPRLETVDPSAPPIEILDDDDECVEVQMQVDGDLTHIATEAGIDTRGGPERPSEAVEALKTHQAAVASDETASAPVQADPASGNAVAVRNLADSTDLKNIALNAPMEGCSETAIEVPYEAGSLYVNDIEAAPAMTNPDTPAEVDLGSAIALEEGRTDASSALNLSKGVDERASVGRGKYLNVRCFAKCDEPPKQQSTILNDLMRKSGITLEDMADLQPVAAVPSARTTAESSIKIVRVPSSRKNNPAIIRPRRSKEQPKRVFITKRRELMSAGSAAVSSERGSNYTVKVRAGDGLNAGGAQSESMVSAVSDVEHVVMNYDMNTENLIQRSAEHVPKIYMNKRIPNIIRVMGRQSGTGGVNVPARCYSTPPGSNKITLLNEKLREQDNSSEEHTMVEYLDESLLNCDSNLEGQSSESDDDEPLARAVEKKNTTQATASVLSNDVSSTGNQSDDMQIVLVDDDDNRMMECGRKRTSRDAYGQRTLKRIKFVDNRSRGLIKFTSAVKHAPLKPKPLAGASNKPMPVSSKLVNNPPVCTQKPLKKHRKNNKLRANAIKVTDLFKRWNVTNYYSDYDSSSSDDDVEEVPTSEQSKMGSTPVLVNVMSLAKQKSESSKETQSDPIDTIGEAQNCEGTPQIVPSASLQSQPETRVAAQIDEVMPVLYSAVSIAMSGYKNLECQTENPVLEMSRMAVQPVELSHFLSQDPDEEENILGI